MTDVSTEQETALSLAEEAYQSLREYVEAIPAEAMLRPGRVGVWSGKDLIVHIAAWEREAVRVVREVAEGKPKNWSPPDLDDTDDDSLNERMVAAVGDISLEAALDYWDASHRALMDAFREAGIDREDILMEVTRTHYRLHYPDFRHVKPFRPLSDAERADLLAEMDAAQAQFLELIDSIPEERLLRERTVGVWSGKDLIAHLGHWLEAAVALTRELERDRPGKWPGEDGANINEWNEARVAGSASLSLAEARAFQKRAFDELRALIAASPYATRSAGIGATRFHYGLHEEDFRSLNRNV